MPLYKQPNLQLFIARLTSRSMLTVEEQQALLGLPAYRTQVPANTDFVQVGEHVDHSCMIVDGLGVASIKTTKEAGKSRLSTYLVIWPTCIPWFDRMPPPLFKLSR